MDFGSAEKFGFVRVAAATPRLKVGNPDFNAKEIKDLVFKAYSEGIGIIVFPELCLTGYTCQDLFYDQALRDAADLALSDLIYETADIPVIYAVGIPFLHRDKSYNCAVLVSQGEPLAVIPKIFLPNTNEFYEKRWFSSGANAQATDVEFLGRKVPFGNVLLEISGTGIVLGTEICEDLWAASPPSSHMASSGANVILNLSASNEMVSKSVYRRDLVLQQSARCICAYVYSSAGVHESSTDLVFSGDSMITENGLLLARADKFRRDSSFISADIDIRRICHDRITSSNYSDISVYHNGRNEYRIIKYADKLNLPDISEDFRRNISPHPFIPSSDTDRNRNCEDIFNIQAAGLAKRLEHTGIKKVFIGVSGGLDSTLALLVAHKTFRILGFDYSGINGITMPGFGTSDRTYQNAVKLMNELGISIEEIDIRPSCLKHFEDIGHDPQIMDTTYENVQARERTQILMDLANKHGGIVIGTGDLSETALGWCTYNGDHMSMYAVNIGVPKTLVKHLIEWTMNTQVDSGTALILADILDTPISPELLPPEGSGKLTQKTEDLIGPYELHDFFLYYFMRQAVAPDKLIFLAARAFSDKYDEEQIRTWLKVFVRRFFSQQFKRSCMPDGPKVGSVALSPRGDWRMSSDTDAAVWLAYFK